MYVKETFHRSSEEAVVRCLFSEALKKLLSDVCSQKQSHMTVEENQVHAFNVMKEDLTNATASLRKSRAKAVAAAAAQTEFLKVFIKDDKPDKSTNRQSTSEL